MQTMTCSGACLVATARRFWHSREAIGGPLSSRAISPDENLSPIDPVTLPHAASRLGGDAAVKAAPRPALTPREREVVAGIIAGRTNKEIARDLGLKEQRVKNLLSTVFQKCGVRSRLELAMYAVRHHLGDH
jgi:DNA-binding NarL/FixJ family response regulator